MNNLISISGRIGSGKDTIGKILQALSLGATNQEIVDYIEGVGDRNLLYGSTYQIKKYADKLKEITCLLIGCTRDQLEDREFKEKELGEEWWYYTDSLILPDKKLIPYLDAEPFFVNNPSWYIIKLTPRLLLQLLGTECGREIIHPNIWVNALFADYNPLMTMTPVMIDFSKKDSVTKLNEPTPVQYPNWIITDVRFPNEAQAIKNRGGIVIRVNRLDVDKFTTNFPQTLHPSETALDNYDFDYVIENDSDIHSLIEKVRELKLV